MLCASLARLTARWLFCGLVVGAVVLLGLLGAVHVAEGVVAFAGSVGVDAYALWLCVGVLWARSWGAHPRRTAGAQVVALAVLLVILFLLSGAQVAGSGAGVFFCESEA